MAFGLTIGTDRANALQTSIQDELIKRGYSPEADAVMAEYITIMIINNKTAEQITAELQELIGDTYEASFTEWLFAEAAKGGEPPQPAPQPIPSVVTSPPVARDAPARRQSTGRSGVYQQALNQAVPSSSPSQKRTASARSPSPNHPNKSRRTGNEPPTGPRAMARDGPNPRSLIERVGRPHRNNNYNDDVQARIDNIVGSTAGPDMMMNGGGFAQGPNPMDMGMAMNGMNPMMLQEMFMNQMAMMAHVMNATGQYPQPGGFPMVPGANMNMLNQNQGMNGFQNGDDGRGRGPSRGGRGGSRGRGGRPGPTSQQQPDVPMDQPAPAPPIAAPTPIPAQTVPPARIPYAIPERPQSPTLCKFGLKCTNAHCRYSHPSPVATVESGVVLSNDPCELGKNCKDKDCVKAHVSPAVLNPQAVEQPPPQPPVVVVAPAPVATAPVPTPCRYGAACTRPGCVFQHPAKALCRFGASCTKPTCPFQHPEARVLPNTFHRGLGAASSASSPDSLGPRGNKSVKFNNPVAGSNVSVKDKLAAQMKELEERKSLAEQAVKEAEAKKSSGPAPASVSA